MSITSRSKRSYCQYLGEYLVKQGILSQAQLDLALWDQARMPVRYRLADIVALRGWVSRDVLKTYTEKVVEPKRIVKHQDRCFKDVYFSADETIELSLEAVLS